jgi:hypothetical protein
LALTSCSGQQKNDIHAPTVEVGTAARIGHINLSVSDLETSRGNP